MSENEAEYAEKLWESYHTRQASIALLSSFEIGVTELEQQLASGAKSERDALKRILENFIKTTNSLHSKKMAYAHLAVFAEQEGKPFFELLKKSVRCDLLNYQSSGVKKVEIYTAGQGSTCEVCLKKAGQIFEIEEALEKMPIPCPKCIKSISGRISGFCRCSYLAVVKKYA